MGTTLSRALAPRAFGLLSAMVIGAFILPLGLTLMGALMNVLLLPLGIGMRGVAIVAAAASSPPPVLTDVPAGNVQILDRHGELLYEFAGPVGGFHYAVPLEGISDHLVNATIATEDASFWHNPGINPRGLLRAAFENLAFWRNGGLLQGTGGSSITQQVVKNLRALDGGTRERDLVGKVGEILQAIELTRRYSREEILQWYLNSLFYGSGAYGAEAAARRYFGKSAGDLDLAEAALLAGMPNAPGAYDAWTNPNAAKDRQEVVLSLMVRHGHISEAEAEMAAAQELDFRSESFSMKAPHFVMYVHELLPRLLGPDAPKRGLQVTTSLDMSLQQKAEGAVERHLAGLERRLGSIDGALVAIDPRSGEILAMVGGRRFFDDPIAGQVNNALALNQPGSALKPITYLAAFMKGWSPATIVPDQPIRLHDGRSSYILRNFDGRYAGGVPAREALASSLNVPAVHALLFAGLPTVHALAGKLGLSTLEDVRFYGPAFTLGGADVTLLDLTFAYSVLASGGEAHGMPTVLDPPTVHALDPVPILRIENARGEVLWQHQPRADRVVPAPHAYQVTHILSDNQARLRTFGPNNPLNLPDRPAAAKTGLTDAERDAWTVGYTPQLVAGVWVGKPNNAPMPGATSSLVAAPIWREFILGALVGEPSVAFDPPGGVQFANVCRASGQPSASGCRQVISEVFVAGQATVATAPGLPQESQLQASGNRDGQERGGGKKKGRR